MQQRYTVGVDYGTESARAVLVDVSTGQEVAVAQAVYRHGVIDRVLPGTDRTLPPDWALHAPEDYLESMGATVQQVLADSGVDPALVIGIGIDTTACTMLPVTSDGTPLSWLEQWRGEPHAWVKLWKHHAAQAHADRLNALARERGGMFLNRYGGKISSEWMFPKTLQMLEEAPEVVEAADRLIEIQDWVTWRLAGVEVRSLTGAGYKAIHEDSGYPPDDFLAALDPRLPAVVRDKLGHAFHTVGTRAGGLTNDAAALTGLCPGTAVAVGNMDAHVSVAGCGVTGPGRMVMVMGTSICHLLMGPELAIVEGMCGVVRDGIVPGWWGFEAGQSAVGDHFGWFRRTCLPAAYEEEAREAGIDPLRLMETKAAALRPGESGLVALDWWNGNRSVLVDVDLTGVLVGATLATTPEEIYRALIEATAFGTRTIVEAFEKAGVPVDELIGCGGLPDHSPLVMQIFADVTGREIRVAAAAQTPALGSAMYASVAAGPSLGGYADIEEAAVAMAHLRDTVYRPTPSHQLVYDELFAEYKELHDYFGRGPNQIMKRLKRLRKTVRGGEDG
ncbi:MAG: araB [Actinomycetia bacterium]|nr:araB [Actinomycetes bacterium]